MCYGFIRWRNVYSSRAKNVQQSIVKTNADPRGNESISSPCCSLPCDFTFLWGPGGGRGRGLFPVFSHMNIHKRQCHAEHAAGLFVGDFLALERQKGFQRASFVSWSWPTRTVQADPPDITRLERKTRYHVNRHFDAQSSHLYSLGCDSLSRSASSETNHKASL